MGQRGRATRSSTQHLLRSQARFLEGPLELLELEGKKPLTIRTEHLTTRKWTLIIWELRQSASLKQRCRKGNNLGSALPKFMYRITFLWAQDKFIQNIIKGTEWRRCEHFTRGGGERRPNKNKGRGTMPKGDYMEGTTCFFFPKYFLGCVSVRPSVRPSVCESYVYLHVLCGLLCFVVLCYFHSIPLSECIYQSTNTYGNMYLCFCWNVFTYM